MAQPPFRADHIGSLLRPAALLDLRRQNAAGKVDDATLHAAEDTAILDAVRMQERLGFGLVTDGELRRRSYHSYFFSALGDITPDYVPPEEVGTAASPRRGVQPVARIASRIERKRPIHVEDYRALAKVSKVQPKLTIPGPCALHFRGGDAAALASTLR